MKKKTKRSIFLKPRSTIKLGSSLSTVLLALLWGLSIALYLHFFAVFGNKINRGYDKKKEKTYKKRIDTLCYSILSVWCLIILVNLFMYGPLLAFYYCAQNIVYIVLTLTIISLWLDRDYRDHKNVRNFMVVFTLWNLIMYFVFTVPWIVLSWFFLIF